MASRCDICLEQNCSNPGHCNCDKCNKKAECPRYLHPTIRITSQCTQSCSHCCFSCSPKKTDMMSIEMARKVGRFIRNNNVTSVNLMGGEFFLNKAWYSITKEFLSSVTTYVRLVSNSDWVNHESTKAKLIKLNSEFNGKFVMSLSNDRWHTNVNVKEADAFLTRVGIPHNVGTEEQGSEESIVPVGRGQSSFGLYSMMGCYCQNTQNQYSFLINEVGEIYKCPFGVWDYANVNDYVDGGFAKKFKEFNSKFYSIFIPSCASCVRAASQKDRVDKNTRGFC